MKRVIIINCKKLNSEIFSGNFAGLVILDTNVIEDLAVDTPPLWFDVFLRMKASGWHFCMSNLAYYEIRLHLSECSVSIENACKFLYHASKMLSSEFPVFPGGVEIIRLLANKNKKIRAARLRKTSNMKWQKISSLKIKNIYQPSLVGELGDLSEDVRDMRNLIIDIENLSRDIDRGFDHISEAMNYECKHLSSMRDYAIVSSNLDGMKNEWSASFKNLEKISGKKVLKEKIKPLIWKMLKLKIKPISMPSPSLRFRFDLLLSVYADLFHKKINNKYNHNAKSRKNDGKDMDLIWDSINCCIICTSDRDLLKLVQRQSRPQSKLFLLPDEVAKLS